MSSHSLISHSCNDNNCTGSTFDGLHVKCSQCGSKTFFDCIKARTGVLDLLILMGVITSNDDTEVKNKQYAQSNINKIFDHNSFFAIRCDLCRVSTGNNEIRRLNGELNEMVNERKKYNELRDKLSQLVSSLNSTSNTTSLANNTSNTAQGVSSQGVNEIVNEVVTPIRDKNGMYPIFITSTNKSISTDGLATLISQKANIDVDTFQITQLTKNRRRSYISFKVITFTTTVFERIVEKENWSEGYTVRAFDNRDSRSKVNKTNGPVSDARKQQAGANDRKANQTIDQNRPNKGQSDRKNYNNQRQSHKNGRRYNATNDNNRSERGNRRYDNRYDGDMNRQYQDESRPPRNRQPKQDYDDDDSHFRTRRRFHRPCNCWKCTHEYNQTRHRSFGRDRHPHDTRRYH